MFPLIERAREASPENLERALKAIYGLEAYVGQSGLERSLLDLVKMRASQMNGCAYCLDMHAKEARAHGETEQRLYLLDTWQESPFYSERERAALAWTEAVTFVADGHVPDETYEAVRNQFSDDELVALTMAVAAINAWNRLNIALRNEPGGYHVAAASATANGSR
jgi:AhpD family alkylhydroperoxidase